MNKLHFNVRDITNQKFGRLTALVYLGNSTWECLCDCGNKHSVRTGKLTTGGILSCGCLLTEVLKKRNGTHGQPKDQAYNTWAHIIQRCTNPKNKSYADYGGRGITVCDRWLSFPNFLEDMGRPEPGMSIDRIDSNKGYYKENCRWADRTTQNRNKRNVPFYTHDGITMTLPEWAERAGIKDETLRRRLEAGDTFAEAITRPVRQLTTRTQPPESLADAG